MKISQKIKLILFTITTLVATSCSDDDSNGSNSNSREVKYEISGNFTGNISCAYTTAGGGTTTESITALPWIKEINYSQSASNSILAIAATGGTQGQIVTVKVYSGNQLKSTTSATAGNIGQLSMTTPAILF